MNLEQIDTSTTAGKAIEWLSRDDAQLALFQAIRDIKFGLPTDDKLILENLRNAGLWIARYEPEPAPPVGPGEAWLVARGGLIDNVSRESAEDFRSKVGGEIVRYIRADLAGEKG